MKQNDYDVLKRLYRFICPDEDDEESLGTQEGRMIKKYYDKLFKEFCLADLSRFREGKVGLRWRTKAEVLSGKGQLICGNKICSSEDSLESLEVNSSLFF
eukprot:TRINITY_DN2253_c0_g1_i4.p1 TRINITY_DN2253_c0_g1~~TRINITY_DN2253_c0_g1_i4.p1  ORF type:complete len:109 (+),score=29.76 TRINITY_DN2253_c0_g1_i4:30-329(+)